VGPGQTLDVPVVTFAAWRPELVLAATLVLGLLAGARARRHVQFAVVAGLVVAAVLAAIDQDGGGPAGRPSHPLGAHFVVDGPAALARLALTALAALVAGVLPRGQHRSATMLVAATLGLVWLTEATTAAAVLLAVGTAVVGGSMSAWFAASGGQRRAVRRWHLTAALGFAVLAYGLALWSGLAGTLEFGEAAANLAARPSLPPLALPLVLSCLGVGLVLSLLGEPGRFQDGDLEVVPAALTGWLTVAPLVGLVVLVHRLVPATDSAAPAVSDFMGALAAVLVIGGFLAAAVQSRLQRRLAWAAAGQVGLALLGHAAASSGGGLAISMRCVLTFAPAQLGAVLLSGAIAGPGHVGLRRGALPVLLAGFLVSLAAVPPLAGWRPRFELLQALVAGDRYLLGGVAAAGTLFGCVVYLRPLVGLWRGHAEPPPLDEAAPAAPAGAGSLAVTSLVAAALFAIVLAWGAGLLRPGWYLD